MSRDSLPPVLPIVWSEQAESDLLEIASYINEQSPQNALAMVGRLQAAVQPLRRFPRFGESQGSCPMDHAATCPLSRGLMAA